MSKTPEIRIFYSWLLAHRESVDLAEKYDAKLDSDEQFEQWTNNYREQWKKHESKIIPAMQACLGIEFYKKVIDVACAPFFVPKSDPFIISFRLLPDQTVDMITHELCHILLTDNNVVQIHSESYNDGQLTEVWEHLFGKHPNNMLAHIPVQAILKHIYLDVLKEPERLARDIKTSDGDAYVESWKYVQKNNYQEILLKLKKSYEGIN